ncbi:MAG: ABC transporter permease, partial [Planctomycetaceae bacterium]|nr:ABC transporter permease [Planctomycetaceae bacterium]
MITAFSPLIAAAIDAQKPLVASFALVVVLVLLSKVPLSYNLLNVLVRWRTTTLTCLAFMLVTGLLIWMLAFVNGMYVLTENSGVPGNLIVLSEGATDEAFSNLGFSDLGDIENQQGVLRENDRQLASRETYLVVNQPIDNAPPGRPKRRFLQVRGIDEPLLSSRVHDIELFAGGKWFSDAGVQDVESDEHPEIRERSAIQVVVGEGIAREMARDRQPAIAAKAKNPTRLDTGDLFHLNDRLWVIVGVMKSSGSTFDSEVWARRSIVGPMFGKTTFSSIVLRTASEPEALKLKEFFNSKYEKAAVSARTEKEYFSSLSETNKQFLYSAMFMTVVMGIGGVFGVMNTMFAAISQRIKDIGVMRLLGYRRTSILVSFLLESLVIA